MSRLSDLFTKTENFANPLSKYLKNALSKNQMGGKLFNGMNKFNPVSKFDGSKQFSKKIISNPSNNKISGIASGRLSDLFIKNKPVSNGTIPSSFGVGTNRTINLPVVNTNSNTNNPGLTNPRFKQLLMRMK